MKAYVVGGAVRDELLGLPVKDRDYVVVGATPEEMARLGYKPVGKDFPVFLHPRTHEEYALARTERKSGRGYKGFTVRAAPDVSLEEDLRRRDLTINAMAKAEDGMLIDPFGGEKDLRAGILRHVSEAFTEDPVRILRVARFAARFDFQVHETTMNLMRNMVTSGEADALVPERVWQEIAKGLCEPRPQRMFEVLEACGLRARLLPELRNTTVNFRGSLPVRFAQLAWPLEESEVTALCDRLRAPNEVRELALVACRNRETLLAAPRAPAQALLELLKRADAFRRPERLAALLEAARLAAPGLDVARVERALAAAAGVDAAAIAATAPQGEIAKRIDDARREAIASAG
ncbi:MAG: multifunctional tRNA nucleotidyl transferase/23-cyclic [Burkholderiales bacterium]|nr:multifunctional tRNA nucleotidyl transferase/23-cyclic [Burkholderiales bacterium]